MVVYRQTFISHAHADNELCDRYAGALRARRVPLYYDRANPQVGHKLGEMLEQELIRARALVVLVTPAALTSFWVGEEIEMYFNLMAKDRSRLLFAVRIAPCDLPPRLATRLGVDALAMTFEQAIQAITAALAMVDGVAVDQHIPPTTPTLPPLGPAPAPPGATAAHHLTPMPLYNLGFRGYSVKGVECILPPVCPVPGGLFIMGSDKSKDAQAHDEETPQYPIEVGPFTMDQHPVTVAEYACAVRANGMREPTVSGGLTWQQQLTHLDHPVVNVTWHDAVAYLRWLAKTTGQPWRLPTEAEWEKAARWDAKRQVSRLYPWGDTFDKTRCNTSEGGKGATTPVASYPNGASPYGAQDMTGNVFEWTNSHFKPYPYIPTDGREAPNSTENRVLRGGSWDYDARVARAACRYGGRLRDFFGNRGFRLVLAASAGS